MNILVLGGDGFVGWPVSLRLSAEGHNVTIVDNFSRRDIDSELGCRSVTPIRFLAERVIVWRKETSYRIIYKRLDVAKNYPGFLDLISACDPDVIIHLAEIRAAPYSMKDAQHKLRTVRNNIAATHNVLCAIVEYGKDIHLIHIGSTGVYGYGGDEACPIPEGYLEYMTTSNDGLQEFIMRDLYPMHPGSIYHMTKCMDAMMFRFYASNDGLRITDLHQGIIWGVQTEETLLHDDLLNRFDYCGDYGTVLNRYIVQGVTGHPITPYGKGQQVRAFIHIRNAADCVCLAIENPPNKWDEPKIFNQTTEQLNISDLAKIVHKITSAPIEYVPNPRVEKEDNLLILENEQFMDLGLEPIRVDSKELEKICQLVYKYRERIDLDKIPCVSYWRKDCQPDQIS
jgi:UDP-sulfoquinovose synthase